MSEGVFSPDECSFEFSDDLARAMLGLVLAFARLDSALSALLIQTYGMPIDRGAMLVENMDIGNKINRLKKLHARDGNSKIVRGLDKLKKDFDKHKEARNTIAHATFYGTPKSDPTMAVFSPIRAGSIPGHLQILHIPAEHMLECAHWATRAAEDVFMLYERHGGQSQRLAE